MHGDTGDTAEPDVEANDDQVEPADGSEYVGRVAGDDLGYAEEQGAEARAAGDDAATSRLRRGCAVTDRASSPE